MVHAVVDRGACGKQHNFFQVTSRNNSNKCLVSNPRPRDMGQLTLIACMLTILATMADNSKLFLLISHEILCLLILFDAF